MNVRSWHKADELHRRRKRTCSALQCDDLFCDGLAGNGLVGIGISVDTGFHIASDLRFPGLRAGHDLEARVEVDHGRSELLQDTRVTLRNSYLAAAYETQGRAPARGASGERLARALTHGSVD